LIRKYREMSEELAEPVRFGTDHCQLKFDYSNLENNEEQFRELIRYIKDYYNCDYEGWNNNQFEVSWLEYNSKIESNIEKGNIDAVECLWGGIYYHDRSYPDYASNLRYAILHGDLKMVEHCLYGYEHNSTFDPLEVQSKEILLELASNNSRNPEIKTFVQGFSDYLVSSCYDEWPICNN